MKIILVDQRHGHTRTIVLKGWAKGLLSVLLLGTPVALGYFGYELSVSRNPQVYDQQTALSWDRQLKLQADQLAEIKQQSGEQLEALTLRLAMLQARLVRLDALGERITTMSNLDGGEFDFSQPVALGGPDIEGGTDYTAPQFLDAITTLERQLSDRQQQLEILEGDTGGHRHGRAHGVPETVPGAVDVVGREEDVVEVRIDAGAETPPGLVVVL